MFNNKETGKFMKKGRLLLCVICMITMMFALAACGDKSNPGTSETNANSDPNSTNESITENTENSNAESTAGAGWENVTYGNNPNNLLQSVNALCFGDGRAYYIDFKNQVVSVALDGSDEKVHGTIENTNELSYGGSLLNYYNGNVYYMITQQQEGMLSAEVRSMDLQNGTETEVASADGSTQGMLIIGDTLFYSCKNVDNTTVTAVNLETKDSNLIFDKKTGRSVGYSAFSTDGTYLYMLIPEAYYEVYRLPLSAVYEADPEPEFLMKIPVTSTIFINEGIYTTYKSDPTLSADLVFYPYAVSGTDWKYETVLTDLPGDGDTDSEEAIIRNLIWWSEKWILEDKMISRSQMNRNLYYSSTLDYRESASVGELAFEHSSQNGSGLYMGVYEDSLYIVLENGDGVTFHKLTSDGTYQ